MNYRGVPFLSLPIRNARSWAALGRHLAELVLFPAIQLDWPILSRDYGLSDMFSSGGFMDQGNALCLSSGGMSLVAIGW